MAYYKDKSGLGGLGAEQNDVISNCVKIFDPPFVERSLGAGKRCIAYPTNNITSTGPFEFHIPGTLSTQIQLDSFKLLGCFKITGPAGAAIADTEDVSLVNNFANSLFSSVELELNGCQVNDVAISNNSYKSYIMTKLSYGKNAKSTHLQMSGWYDDEEGKSDKIKVGDNKGVHKRNELIKGGKKCYFATPLFIPILHSPRLLPTGVDMKFKFIKQKDAFIVLAFESKVYEVHILDLKLYYNRVELNPTIKMAIEQAFMKEVARYPVCMSKFRMDTITAGVNRHYTPTLFRGKIPYQIILGFVSNDATSGTQTTNPYYFGSHNVSYVNLTINGQCVTGVPFEPRWSDKNWMHVFMSLMNNIGIGHDNADVGISIDNFKDGNVFYAIDLTPNNNAGFLVHPQEESGNIDLEIKFSNNTTESLSVISLAFSHEEVIIDKDRNVSTTW